MSIFLDHIWKELNTQNKKEVSKHNTEKCARNRNENKFCKVIIMNVNQNFR